MIKLINKSDDKIMFKSDINVSLANAIRRSANYIPIVAIDSLELSKNDSALYDEIIAHRIGLVPLKNEDLKLPEECDCGKDDGCGKCSVKFKLSASGPCTVYSSDMSPKNSVLYKMPITLLAKDQELEFVAIAKMGQGIKHAKFSPGIIYYRYSEDLEKEDDESFKKILEESKKNSGKELTVFIESWGQIKAKDMFIDAIGILNKEIKELVKSVK
jgi:DNA-directed RNA polymerase subunit D